MFDAIVLAGGAARRLGGADKPGLVVGGSTLLDRVLDAVAAAGVIVVAGPRRVTARPVTWVREDPPGAGPVAGIAAGIGLVRADVTLVLATDLPGIGPAVPVLLRAVSDSPAAGVACLVESSGQVNYLAAAWRTAALRAALEVTAVPNGAPVRALVAASEMIEVPDQQGWGYDCDTWEELAGARERAER
jgi:molybdopterin-guanine dinucleotide biosynthesis protein A